MSLSIAKPIVKYIELSKQMPERLSEAKQTININNRIISSLYDSATPVTKKFLINQSKKLSVMTKIYENIKQKHIIASGIIDKYPEFRDNFITENVSNDYLDLPMIAILTGATGYIISEYEKISGELNRQNKILVGLENGVVSEKELAGFDLVTVTADGFNFPVVLVIAGSIFTGYYLLFGKN